MHHREKTQHELAQSFEEYRTPDWGQAVQTAPPTRQGLQKKGLDFEEMTLVVCALTDHECWRQAYIVAAGLAYGDGFGITW
jgi:hypothetical protein